MPSSTHPVVVSVVAAVVRRRGRLLLCRRPSDKRHGGLWEFPGGKLRPGESLQEAAGRELAEELALTVVATGDRLFSAVDPGSPYRVEFLEVSVCGEPDPAEHPEIRWCTAAEALGMDLAPCDARFLRSLVAAGNDNSGEAPATEG